MTTDIKSRLSELGKQWKEKMTQKQAAEEAREASPAEGVAQEERKPPAEAPAEAGQNEADADAVTVSESKPAEAGTAGSGGESAPQQVTPPEKQEAEESGRVSDETLAAVLLSFGWHISRKEKRSVDTVSSEADVTAPALEELAAEVSAAMDEFGSEIVNVYEEEASAEKPGAQEEPAPVSDDTAVFTGIGAAEAEKPAAAEQKEAFEEQTTAEKPEPAPEVEEQPINSKEFFGGMNQEILKEVFSEEELNTLEGDDTHVFKKEELEDLNGKKKEAEEKAAEGKKRRREAPDRRRTKRAADKPATEKTAGKPAGPVPGPELTPRDYRPIRRKRSYRTGLRGGLMYFGFVICVSVILASVGWLAADDVLSLNKDYVEAEVYVGEDLDMKQVSSELYNKGLIKYRQLFRIFAKLMKADKKIEPGVYSLSSKLDYNAMVHAMHHSESHFEERTTVKVTIPEGKTLKQTFQILAEHGVCPYETLLECSAGYEFKYDFLEGLPYGSDTRLEGYLFPDTYEFFAPSDPEEAIDKFLDNFDSKVTAEMRLQAEEMGYTLHEIITVASLVEMEAGKDTERATISSVIYNRLSSSYYPYLQIDATIQYALEERKESLTNADLEIDSPYNTYKYAGLPPGPIANPGLASIRAALAPESTGYYFYALNKSGSHNFFATVDQFNYFVNSSEFGG